MSIDIRTTSQKLLSFVRDRMESFSCKAHDIAHCYRVANLALKLADASQDLNLRLIYIAGACFILNII